MRIKLKQRVKDTQENKIIEAGEVIERDDERGKAFLAYGTRVEEPKEGKQAEKPKKKSRKKKE